MFVSELIKKYKDEIAYIFFGVCTTLVNVVLYWGLAHLLNIDTVVSTIVAWFAAVLFAYVTNRKWVFHSEANEKKEVVKEWFSFFSCRVITGIVDLIIMYIFVDILAMNDIIIKFISNVIVIVLNYLASKLLIFRKNGNGDVDK